MRRQNQDQNISSMKKLILNSNSNLIFLYLLAILLICVLVGLSSLDFYSGSNMDIGILISYS